MGWKFTTRAWSCALATAVVLPAVAPPAHATDRVVAGYEVSLQDGISRNWKILPDGTPVLTPSALAPGTSPAITGLYDGGYAQAFVASDGTLWVEQNGNGHQLVADGHPWTPAPGTSPAIAPGSAGGWVVAWNAGDRVLTMYGPSQNEQSTYVYGSFTAPPAAGTNPALIPYGEMVTWVDKFGHLRWSGLFPDGEKNWSGTAKFTVQPGTSPAIAAYNGSYWKIAVQADTSRLWTVEMPPTGDGHHATVAETPSAMVGSPSITLMAAPDGQADPTYGIAFTASSGRLWYQDEGGGHEIPGALSPATSPSIQANGTGRYRIAFQDASTHTMKTFDSGSGLHDTAITMAPNTSPSITALWTDTPPPAADPARPISGYGGKCMDVNQASPN